MEFVPGALPFVRQSASPRRRSRSASSRAGGPSLEWSLFRFAACTSAAEATGAAHETIPTGNDLDPHGNKTLRTHEIHPCGKPGERTPLSRTTVDAVLPGQDHAKFRLMTKTRNRRCG
ncbi:hypothetical protein [Saccharothrix lopnurensis]|uniref:Uncharacterized protein n=1 Tax=Saccharothrix lopnurensis TaxID=1670621 RepID=A0ABW1NWJ1_9PSEU